MKKLLSILKRLNPHIVLPILILFFILGTVFFIMKWARGVDSEYDPSLVEEGYDIEVLDRTYYMTPEQLGEHVSNEPKKILCFGNAPFADDRDSEDNLCNMMAEKTGAEVVNLSIPDSYLAMIPTEGDAPSDPRNYHTFYFLMCMGILKDDMTLRDYYNENVRGISEVGDEVVDYLFELDMETVDTIVLMYDAADYLDGRIKETPANTSNPYTFCGNMYAGIDFVQKNYPHIQIIVMSPTYAYAIDEDGNYVSSDIIKVEGETLSSYAITQLNLCLVAEVTFIDHIYGTVNCDNADMYLTDNVHLNKAGREAVATRFAEIYQASWDRYF